MYEISYGLRGQAIIRRLRDGTCFPVNADNPDFKEFLDWNAKQSTPLDLSDKQPVAQADPEASMQQRLIDYLKADPQTITAAQRDAALRAIIRLVLRREGRLAEVDK